MTSERSADLGHGRPQCRAFFVSGLILAVALAGGCKPASGPSDKTAAKKPTPKSAAMKRLEAEVPAVLVERVMADARRVFGGSKEAHQLWPAPEDASLAYYRSVRMIASAARADGWTSNPTVVDMMDRARVEEYFRALFKRTYPQIPVNEAAIRAYYEENLSDYVVKGEFSMRQIFLNTIDNPGKEKEKEELAKKILSDLKKGTSFTQLALQYSDNEVKDEIIGPIDCGEINPVIEKAIMALEPGQISDIIQTKSGYHIFRAEKVVHPTTKTLEQVRDSIVAILQEEQYPEYEKLFRAHLEQKYPAKRYYDILDSTDTADSAIVADSSFFTLTAGDYRKKLEVVPPAMRAQLKDPDFRRDFLDSWIMTERVRRAAADEGLAENPDIKHLLDYAADVIVGQNYLEWMLGKLTRMDESEIRQHYDNYRQSYTKEPEKMRIRELVLRYSTGRSMPPREIHLNRMKMKALAAEIAEKLKAGAKFEDLVRQYSTAPSKEKDGDLGLIDPDRRWRFLRENIAKIQVGEWIGPLDEGEQFSFFRLEEIKPAVLVPYDETFKNQMGPVLLRLKRQELAVRIHILLAQNYNKKMSPQQINQLILDEIMKEQNKGADVPSATENKKQ